MPLYEYECPIHGRFTVSQPMFGKHEADCLVCQEPAERKFSCVFRMADPVTVLQDLGKHPDGSHKGYQILDWKADSGISPKPGQPYKTAKEVERER